jgi:hypothetical protein
MNRHRKVPFLAGGSRTLGFSRRWKRERSERWRQSAARRCLATLWHQQLRRFRTTAISHSAWERPCAGQVRGATLYGPPKTQPLGEPRQAAVAPGVRLLSDRT